MPTLTTKRTVKKRPKTTKTPPTEVANVKTVWSRMVSNCEPMSLSVARFFVNFDFPDADHQRMAELNQRANEGLLTPEEKAEMADYIGIGSFISVMKLKARRVLAKHGHRA
ncbi:MAG: hypothetical protein ACKV2Q_04910 [Planctomycetaceae bacterium]